MSFSFGDVVRRGRERAGLSQAKVAQLIGKSQSTIRAWEQGRSNPADPQAVSTLAALLGLNEEDLLHRAGFEVPFVTTARKSAREELMSLTAERTITMEVAPLVPESAPLGTPRHLFLSAAAGPVSIDMPDVEVGEQDRIDEPTAPDGVRPFDLDEVTVMSALAPPVVATAVTEPETSAHVTEPEVTEIPQPSPIEPALVQPIPVDAAKELEPQVVALSDEARVEAATVSEPTPATPKPPKPRKVTTVQRMPTPKTRGATTLGPVTMGPAISYIEDEEQREFYKRRALGTTVVCVALVIIFWWALKRAGGALVDFVASLVDGLNF